MPFGQMSDLRPYRRSADCSDDQWKDTEHENVVRPKLRSVPGRIRRKPTDFQAREVEMSDLNAVQGSATTDHNVNDSEMSFENDNQTDKALPSADRGCLLSNQAAVAVDETIGNITDEDTPKAFNLYRNKKLLSHGMMDVALFSANANQLRYVLESSDGGAVSVICVVLLLISIFLQILVGVALLLSARYNVTNYEQRKMAFKLGNYVIVGIFLITVVNIFITSFGGPTTILTESTTELQSDLNRSNI